MFFSSIALFVEHRELHTVAQITGVSQEASLINLAFFLLLVQVRVRRGAWLPLATSPTDSVPWGRTPRWLDQGVLALLGGARVLRWRNAQHFPWSNLYESLVFLAFLLVAGIRWLEQTGSPAPLIALTGVCPLLVLGFASFSLPPELQEAGPLVPALKSNWLLRHVTVRILSYAGLRLGSLLAVRYLAAQRFANLSSWLGRLDELSYRLIGFGFPFLTLGILSGAVWANETWGSYWSWDPKETWSLITWLVFAAYLHTRLVKGQTGGPAAKVAAVGFILVWVCYLGVNLLGKGLHSYGWFSGS